MNLRKLPHFLFCIAALGCALTLTICLPVQAQIKIGSNPTSIVSGAKLQIDGDASTATAATMIINSAGNVGINTAAPGNKLEVKQGTAGNSGVRLTNLPSASILGTNASGDIISSTATSTCICGEVRSFLIANPGSDWYKLDGSTSAPANSCGISGTLPNASNAYAVQNGTSLGSVSGSNSKTIAKANLPNYTLTGTALSAGAHTHATRQWFNAIDWGHLAYPANNNDGGSNWDGSTGTAGAHTHSVEVNSGGNGTALDITPKSLSVNMFVCLH